ncbi:hypothetical protein FRB95_014835 [Tulasnella sp. JGI-2019a]|nr:hypothetical protein FRB95_014835 [Tulasnella sp. JGI-2019a]
MDELSNPTTYTALIRNTEICHYFSLVSVVIVIWDWATTFDNEIAYIWVGFLSDHYRYGLLIDVYDFSSGYGGYT